MKPEELRISNLVHVPKTNQNIPVTIINKHVGVCVNDGFVWLGFEEIKPIELTEEWLLKFGFDQTTPDKWFALNICNDWTFLFWNNNVLELSVNRHGVVLSKIEYVHQLQNLYFALTGEELTVKEEK